MADERPSSDYRPKYYELLSEPDQVAYTELRASLSSQMCRNRRGKRLEGFADMLASIRTFCVRHNCDDWKRSLVCGVCWLPNGIAINNRQLSILIDKCKSSINGSLQKMGYSTLQSRTESSGSLCDAIPVLKNNFNELREWTVRLFVAATPQPNLPMYSVNTLYPFQSPAPSQYAAMWAPMRAAPAPAHPPATDAASTFFGDEFSLPPVLLPEDVGPPRAKTTTPFDIGDAAEDPFGLFGDKW
jgi:hypothetical protein